MYSTHPQNTWTRRAMRGPEIQGKKREKHQDRKRDNSDSTSNRKGNYECCRQKGWRKQSKYQSTANNRRTEAVRYSYLARESEPRDQGDDSPKPGIRDV